jgi:hypothetical protein
VAGAERRYDAFISYSHATDGALAPALQRGLMRLAKPWHRRQAISVGARLVPGTDYMQPCARGRAA